jgi:tetratricopeptide (TPR) repeat protein/predicted Ser/Thr protein kinase
MSGETTVDANPRDTLAGGPGLPLARGQAAMVGRYVLLERVGAGGMGVVHRAYDPALDRRIAVKQLRPMAGNDPRRILRLHREARAAAQINHPNVVAVHDVSTVGDDVFIAMEFIDGPTLATWLRSPHGLEAIVAVFEQAGEGLAAAHDKGVVHRDFKPDNVFVTAAGRVVVADFGIARTSRDEATTQDNDPRPASWDVALTRPGPAPGTPGYMAPEQLRGAPASARADQFTFCVVLWEALYGVPPFERGGAPADELCSMERGPGLPAQPRHRVPRWLEDVLRRGMAIDPEQRFTSLRELLEALRRGRRRRRNLVVALSALAVALVAGTALAVAPGTPGPCQRADAQLRGIWDDAVKAQVARALSPGGAPLAAETTRVVRERLDGYATSWLGAHQDACAATHVRHEQSEATLDLRMRCLRRRRLELGAFTAQLAGVRSVADSERSVTALGELVPVAACADGPALAAGYPPILDPGERRRAEDLQRELAEARAAHALGRYQQARERLEEHLPAVRELGHAPLLVDFLVERGRVLRELADFETMRPVVEEAALEAGRAGRDDALVMAQSWLVFLEGVGENRPEQALDMLPLVRPVAARLAADSAEVFELDTTEARVRLLMPRGDLGLEAIDRVLRSVPETDAGRRTVALQLKARILRNLDAPQKALPIAEEAVAMARRAFGARHPKVGTALTQLADMLAQLGKRSEARAVLEDAIAILRVSLPENHRNVAHAKFLLAGVLGRLGGHEQALSILGEARAAYRAEMGEMSAAVRAMDHQRGTLLFTMGRFREAAELYARTLERLLAGEDDPREEALLRESLGEAALHDGQLALARTECAAGLAIHRRSPADENAQLPYALDCLGGAELALGRPKTAIPLLREALALRLSTCTPPECAITRYFLGRALWDGGGDRNEAIALVRDALTVFERDAALEPWIARYPAQARAWLDSHRP